MAISEEEYQQYRRNVSGETGHKEDKGTKKHKYNAKKVEIDGHVFASKWEGKVYSDLKWQYLAGLITEPLLQISFALGVHYGKMRHYVADFTFIELPYGKGGPGRLVVADAKGHETTEYKQKKRVFKEIYGFCIKEFKKLDL